VNLPHIQFYVGDWRKDMGIQSLSYHHRGVWFELLLLMHCSEERGKLVLNGRPMTSSGLARLLGMTEGEVKDAVDVLIASGVASREATGAVVNRRMVREEEIRRKRVEAGSKGGAKAQAKREQNPDIDNGTDNGLERVREFARSVGISEADADWFYWKGRANGWTNGGKPILDWKATLRSWQKGKFLPSQRQGNQNRPTEFVRSKEKPPSYPQLPPKRQPTEAELAEARRIAQEHVAKLKEQFKMP
jgi:uncharacterized protein YdaU (DUF1376 family)